MIFMARIQFNLRQLLIVVAIAAVMLLLIRFSLRSYGLAVGLIAFALGGVALVLINTMIYAFLRGVGAVYGMEPERPEPAKQSTPSTPENLAPSEPA